MLAKLAIFLKIIAIYLYICATKITYGVQIIK